MKVSILTFTFFSAFFLLRGALTLSARGIADLAMGRWGYNFALAKNLCQQRIDSLIGFVFLVIAVLMQIIDLLWETRIGDLEINRSGLMAGLVFSFSVFLISLVTGRVVRKQAELKVKALLAERYPEVGRTNELGSG